jgi:uncharacterized protein with GYD domain
VFSETQSVEVQMSTFRGIMLRVERVSPPGKREEGGKAGMPAYIVLMNWTDQGVRTVKDTVQRREQADALAERHGARIEQVYWTVGPYDIVAILDAPDDESATALMLELSSAGNLRTTTLRAYDREEMSGILQRLG